MKGETYAQVSSAYVAEMGSMIAKFQNVVESGEESILLGMMRGLLKGASLLPASLSGDNQLHGQLEAMVIAGMDAKDPD